MRYAYSDGDMKARGKQEIAVHDVLGGGRLHGSGLRVCAYGIRNPVGLAINPATGQLWASVNEREELGDNLLPDYITHVQAGGFYGWPWFYTRGTRAGTRS